MPRILVLAGTTEATQVAGLLVDAGHDVTSSLAGVTTSPAERAGRVRHGGFGGTAGLAHHLVEHRIDALIDATHPFAAVMPFHAAEAASSTGVAHCRLLRPAWVAADGDRWQHVPSIGATAQALRTLDAHRVFLTVGRQQLAAFDGCAGIQFLVRAVEPPEADLPGAEVILRRGPFTLDDELALLREHRIDTLVTKNSGGAATAPKLEAARLLGVTVVMIDRPPSPPVPTFEAVDEVTAWCASVATNPGDQEVGGGRPSPS